MDTKSESQAPEPAEQDTLTNCSETENQTTANLTNNGLPAGGDPAANPTNTCPVCMTTQMKDSDPKLA